MFPGKVHSAVVRKSGRGGKAGLLLFPPGYKPPQCLSLCLSVSLPLCFHFSWSPQTSPVCLEGQQGEGREEGGAGGRWYPGPAGLRAPHWARLLRCPVVFSLETASYDCCY